VTKELNLDYVRSQFPGLANGWAFFDNAGGTQILTPVVERINDFLFNKNVQTGGSYAVSLEAARALEQGREAMMALVNARRPEEIAFAASTTVALQNLARSMASQFEEGDEIIVTVSDHESNIGPWVGLESVGVKIKFWNIDKATLELRLEDLEPLMTERTRLVAVTHVSNILGTINPVGEIASFVHERGALICVDSVAFAPHRAIDVQDWDVDFLAFSLYKVYGPHFAVLYGKYELFAELDNLYHYFYGKDKIPAKLEPGNASYELAYGSTGIVKYLSELGEQAGASGSVREKIVAAFESITAHENKISERLLAYLRSRDDCLIVGHPNGDDPARVPTISFKIAGVDSGELAKSVDDYKVAIRFGDFHARRLIEYLELTEDNGVARVSLTHYNTLEEVDALIEAFGQILD
jgi:cysteine desulfurase family protein (TIGR01976 family)